MKKMTRRARVACRVFAATTVAGVLAAPAVQAHVTVNPDEAEKGGYAALVFRTPNERDDASTVEVQVNLPVDEHPIRSVRVRPQPGWDYEVETVEVNASEVVGGARDDDGDTVEVVSAITWSGGEVQPNEYEDFEVSMGRLPEDADEIVFPTIQVYDSGEEVGWIEQAAEGEEVESPAPALTLVDPEAEHGDDAAGSDEEDSSGDGEQATGPSVENLASQDDVDSANRFALLGILVGVVGVATGAVSLVRGRRST